MPGLTRKADTRVRCAERHQVRMVTFALDELLPDDHPARVVWEYVEGVDVSALYGPIRSVEGRAGRSAVDPKILLALWLYATLDGVGSAREVDRLCRDHAARGSGDTTEQGDEWRREDGVEGEARTPNPRALTAVG